MDTANGKKLCMGVLYVFLIILAIQQIHVYVSLKTSTININYHQSSLVSNEEVAAFVWQDYLALNPDLVASGKLTESDALEHYLKYGKREKRNKLRLAVKETVSMKRMKSQISDLRYSFNGASSHRSLVLMYIGAVSHIDSLDVLINNIKIFCATIAQPPAKKLKTVYLFVVVGGGSNPLFDYIPRNIPNVFVSDLEEVSDESTLATSTSLSVYMRTLHQLGDDLLSQFGVVICLNQFARGPLVRRQGAEWIGEFRRLMDDSRNVGLVGSTTSCRARPGGGSFMDIDTHAFALRASISGKIVRSLLDPVHHSYIDSGRSLLEVVGDLGYNASSVLLARRDGLPCFDSNRCVRNVNEPNPDPVSWCDLKAEEAVFFHWGGAPLNTPGFMCESALYTMRDTLKDLSEVNPTLQLMLPETTQGGELHDLFKQFSVEVERTRLAITKGSNSIDINGTSLVDSKGINNVDSKLCLLVRTTSIHDVGSAHINTPDYNEGLTGVINSLLSQTNPNWIAYFFVTDDRPFDGRLQEILAQRSDSRLRYVNIDPAPRLKFTKTDAGFTATDHVLRYVAMECPECRWITVTNGDNSYGSEVVARTLSVETNRLNRPAMLISPLDSRNFAEQDSVFRGEKEAWTSRCKGVRAMMRSQLLAATVQGIPILGRVDLAAVSFLRSQLITENLYFGNFTNPSKYSCLGCQDGYLTEYLVRNRLWSYLRLPIDGLQSVVFHGPSPTLCIASGNVWFDHPHVDKVGCYTHRMLVQLRKADEVSSSPLKFDWRHFNTEGRMCLRLTKQSFDVETKQALQEAKQAAADAKKA